MVPELGGDTMGVSLQLEVDEPKQSHRALQVALGPVQQTNPEDADLRDISNSE